jgi:hypothetical protein
MAKTEDTNVGGPDPNACPCQGGRGGKCDRCNKNESSGK